MEQIKTKVRRWGNSFGIVIPKDVVAKEGLEEDNEIIISLQSRRFTEVKDIFGILKTKSKRETQEILDEIDKEMWPKEE